MAMTGGKPVPTAIKRLHGNPGKRPLNGDEPQPDSSLPEPPAFLGFEAVKEWNRIAPELNRLGLLTVVDRAALTAYCEAWATYMAATIDLRTNGTTLEGYRGNTVKNPAAQVQRDAAAMMLKICAEFGMTPSSRSRMVTPQGNPDEDRAIEAILS